MFWPKNHLFEIFAHTEVRAPKIYSYARLYVYANVGALVNHIISEWDSFMPAMVR